MPSSYPTSIDTLPNPTPGTALNDSTTGLRHSDQHANANNAIVAVQTELGTVPSAGHASVAARLTVMDVLHFNFAVAETAAIAANDTSTQRVYGARTIVGVRASLKVAQTSGSVVTFDVKKNGTTIFSTKVTIDNTEKTSTTAAVAAVLSSTTLSDDDELSAVVHQIGDGTAKGASVLVLLA